MEKEYHTRIRAEVYLTLRSDRPLYRHEVHNILAEMHYEFGDDDSYALADGESARLCATEWEDNEIVSEQQVA